MTLREPPFPVASVIFYDTYVYSNLSERLNLSHDEGEKWIVNLIRETRMGADAKIDLEKVCPCLLCHPTIHATHLFTECYRN